MPSLLTLRGMSSITHCLARVTIRMVSHWLPWILPWIKKFKNPSNTYSFLLFRAYGVWWLISAQNHHDLEIWNKICPWMPVNKHASKLIYVIATSLLCARHSSRAWDMSMSKIKIYFLKGFTVWQERHIHGAQSFRRCTCSGKKEPSGLGSQGWEWLKQFLINTEGILDL